MHHIDPLFHQVGRVTFHLAENKRDPERPFAFLATYAHRITENARVSHLPLAEALKAYATAKDRSKLKTLLQPVERAAELSPLVRELLDQKTLFSPQAWSNCQAYRFLQEAQSMEQAGVVLRLPDWWTVKRPPRPQVQVNLGNDKPNKFSLDGVLDFNVQLAMDGEVLTDAERVQLLASTGGLMLLRGKWVEVDSQKIQEALAHWKSIQAENLQGIGFIQGMRLLAGADLNGSSEEASPVVKWSKIEAGDWLRETLEKLRTPQPEKGCQPGRDLKATLRPY